MRVSLPYVFEVTGIERRHRNPATVFYADWTWVEIAEAAPDDAPVAVRWQPPPREDIWRQTRWHGDRHWIEFSNGNGGNLPVTALPDCDPEMLCRLLDYVKDDREAIHALFSPDGRRFDPDDFREIHEVRREEGLARLERSASCLLSVGGILHRETVEPRYIVSFRGPNRGEQRPSAFISVETEWNIYSYLDTGHFRLDRLDDAREYVRDQEERHVIRHVDRVELILPQSIQFDDEAFTLLATCRRLTGIQKGADCFDLLRTMDTEPACAWFHLRDAVSRPGPFDEDELQSIAEMLETFARGLPEGSLLAREARNTIRRWALRPVQVQSFEP